MPREIAMISTARLTLADVLQAAANVDDQLVPRAVLGGWAVQLVDLDDVAVLTVEQSRQLDRTDDVARITGRPAAPGPAWWTEATAPWGRAGEPGVQIARAIAERLDAQFLLSEGA